MTTPWKVREAPRIGVKVLYEVYKVMENGDTIFRGRYEYKDEAERLATKLNEEEARRDTVRSE